MSARRCTLAAGAALALGLALAIAGCDGVLVQPATGGRAVTIALDLAPSAGGDAEAFERADSVHLRVQRRRSGEWVLDRRLGLTRTTGGKEVSVAIQPNEDPETFDLDLQLFAGTQPLFEGAATVTIQHGQASDAEVSLEAVVASLTLSPTSVTLSAINQIFAVQAYTLFSSGDTSRSATVLWTSGNPAIVTVSPAGVLTSRGEGQTQVTATAGPRIATLQVRVQAVVASVTVAPAADTLTVGDVLSLTATARDANGTALTRTATWTSSNPAVASVDAAGRVQALAPGVTTVTGAVEGKTGSSVIQVVLPPVASVTVVPSTATVQAGGTVQLQAELRTAAGQLVTRTTAWSSANPAIATVGTGGLVAGAAPGTTTITATAESVSGTAQITVTGNPDLVITSGTPTPTPAVVTAGGTVTMPAWSVANRGNAAAGAFASGFYLSADATITAADVFLGDAAANTSGLPAGATSSKAAQVVTIPASTAAGNYWIGMLVDRAGAVQESDEANNYVAAPIQVVAPVIAVSPSSLAFAAAQGGSDPASQTLAISNAGAGTLTWSVSDDATWLTLSPTSGSGNGSVTASVSSSALAEGTYSATITVTGNASNSPRTVPVTLTVSAGPSIALSPASLSFSGVQGGANPASQTLSVANAGGGTLSWTASDDAAWLTLTPTTGTNAGNVTVGVATNGLAAGTYSATISVAGNASNSPRTVPVTLTVTPGPAIGLSPASLTFSGVQGGANPGNQAISVSNTGGGTLSWAVSDDATWLTLSPISGTNTGSVTASVATTGLGVGTYTATITVTGNAANSPRTLPVTLNVTMPPPAAPTSLTAGGVSISQINLAWTDLANNESGFSIERCQGAGCTNFAQIGTVGANVTTYQDTGLPTATTYVYRVRAYNATGYSGYSGTATAATTSGVAPVLSGGGYTVNIISDSRCNLYPTRLGTTFKVTFSFSDADGDAWLSSSAVGGSFVFTPSGSSGSVGVTYATGPTFTGNGSSGTVTTTQCYVFGSDTYVDVTMTFRDLAGNTGQLSPIRITKPAGAN